MHENVQLLHVAHTWSKIGKEIDVHLQPLFEKLKQLWTIGVQTFDALLGQLIQLYATLL